MILNDCECKCEPITLLSNQGGTPHARARVSLVSWEERSHALLFMVPLGLPSARPMAQALWLPFEYYNKILDIFKQKLTYFAVIMPNNVNTEWILREKCIWGGEGEGISQVFPPVCMVYHYLNTFVNINTNT